jgi:hypothetical protein
MDRHEFHQRLVELGYGTRVVVPWGLDEIEGTVVYVYGPPGHQSVMVRIPIQGTGGQVLDEEEISFPREALKTVPAA